MSGIDPITFIDDVPADTVKEKSHEFRRSGKLTRLEANTYVNQEFALRYTFRIRRESNTSTNLVEPLGKAYLAGNGEKFDVPLRVDFERGDELVIKVENTTGREGNPAYLYHANALVQADYDGGPAGLLSELFGGAF